MLLGNVVKCFAKRSAAISPSTGDVPVNTSSMITKLNSFSLRLLIIVDNSFALITSDLNNDAPVAMSSAMFMKQFNFANGVSVNDCAGVMPKVCAINTLSITPLMTVDLPPVFGPVRILLGCSLLNVTSLITTTSGLINGFQKPCASITGVELSTKFAMQ